MDKIKDALGIRVYPNPTDAVVTVQTNKGIIQRIQVMDLLGRVLNETNIDNNKTDVSLKQWASGQYLLQIKIAYQQKEYVLHYKIDKVH